MTLKAPKLLSKLFSSIDRGPIHAQDKKAKPPKHDINLCTTDLTISVCSKKDIETWTVAAEYIIRNIESKSFMLIVPQDSLGDFIRRTPSEIQVISEEEVIPSSFLKIIEEHLDPTTVQSTRGGWIYQQFLKMQGAIDSQKDRIALWDADTVPLKKISFFDDKNRARFYTSNEHHRPYFEMINSILGCSKIYKYSFIAQSIPFKRQWIIDLCREIEDRTGSADWKLGILSCMRSALGPSPFSEYETIGTYAMSRLNETDKPIPQANSQSWVRNGYELIGPAANLSFFNHASLHNAAFVSFERWSKPFSHYSRPHNSQVFSSSDSKMPIRLKLALSIAYDMVKMNFKSAKTSIKNLASSELFLIFDNESEGKRLNRFLSDFFLASPFATIMHIGTNNGIMDDHLKPFLPVHKGSIILAESMLYYCNKLEQLYSTQNNIQVVNASIASKEEMRDLFYISPLVVDEMDGDGPMNKWAHGQAAFVKDTLVSSIYKNQFRGTSYRHNAQRYIDSIQTTCIKTMTLASIAKKYQLAHIELLVIDVQGAELETLSSLHELESLPRFIVYRENLSLLGDKSIKIESLLANCGYVFISGNTSRLWGLDSTSVSRSSLGL
jgi:FkbM family methyltransferase